MSALASLPGYGDFCCDECGATWNAASVDAVTRYATGSRFSDVWAATKYGPYDTLPLHRVTLTSFFERFMFALSRDARRILEESRDILPPYQKLIRANGTCLSGEWRITEDSPYTGYFRKGSRGLIIARASVGLTHVELGSYRAFGMALKLFPTWEEDDPAFHRTANAMFIDDNAGTLTAHYLDAQMANKALLSINGGALRTAHLLGAITLAQRMADSFSRERELYPIAELGEPDPKKARAPRFLMVQGKKGHRVPAQDFRDELRVSNYPAKRIEFQLSFRETEEEQWTPIGELSFGSDACSAGCDHRLHFPHPLWRRFQSEKED